MPMSFLNEQYIYPWYRHRFRCGHNMQIVQWVTVFVFVPHCHVYCVQHIRQKILWHNDYSEFCLSVVSFNREKISIYYSLVRKLNSEKKEIYKNKTISQTKGAFLK